MTAPSVCCPECDSLRVWRDGVRQTKNGEVQRYLCRSCGYRFSQPNVKVNVSTQRLKRLNSGPNFPNMNIARRQLAIEKRRDSLSFQRGEDVASHGVTVVAKPINMFRDYNRDHQVCVTETKGAKNLVTTAKQIELQLRDNQQINEMLKGKLIEFAWWLYKNGKAEITIDRYDRSLRMLINRGANILDPESVKETIAKQHWSQSSKQLFVAICTTFLKFLGKTWEKPRYHRVRKIPFIPTEETLNQLIAGLGHKTSAFCQLLKETGIRPVQACKLEWEDIDFDRCILRITSAKHGNPLIKKVSRHLVGRMKTLPKKSKLVFGKYKKPNAMANNLLIQRKRLARKLGNPNLARITLYTFRYWYGTTLYYKTKDPRRVQHELGHKSLEHTDLYIQIAETLYDDRPENYYVSTAETSEEFDKLLTDSWEYVATIEFNNKTLHKFRKPK